MFPRVLTPSLHSVICIHAENTGSLKINRSGIIGWKRKLLYFQGSKDNFNRKNLHKLNFNTSRTHRITIPASCLNWYALSLRWVKILWIKILLTFLLCGLLQWCHVLKATLKGVIVSTIIWITVSYNIFISTTQAEISEISPHIWNFMTEL